jgi:hypothetical protein
MPGVYDDEWPFDYPGSSQGEADSREMEYCEGCDRDMPLDEGTSHIVGVTQVDRMVVSEEHEWRCKECSESEGFQLWP